MYIRRAIRRAPVEMATLSSSRGTYSNFVSLILLKLFWLRADKAISLVANRLKVCQHGLQNPFHP